MFTLTPSAFLLLPLFPPERGMSTKRKRNKMVKKNGTKAEKRREGIVVPSYFANWKETLYKKSTAKINEVSAAEKKRTAKTRLRSFSKFPLIDQQSNWLSVSPTKAGRQVEDGRLRAEANFSWRPETFLSLMVGNSPSFLVSWPQYTVLDQWQSSMPRNTLKSLKFWVMEGMEPHWRVCSALPWVNISDTEQGRPACQPIQTSPSVGSALIAVNLLIVVYEIIIAACVWSLFVSPSVRCCPGGFHSIYRVLVFQVLRPDDSCRRVHKNTYWHTQTHTFPRC